MAAAIKMCFEAKKDDLSDLLLWKTRFDVLGCIESDSCVISRPHTHSRCKAENAFLLLCLGTRLDGPDFVLEGPIVKPLRESAREDKTAAKWSINLLGSALLSSLVNVSRKRIGEAASINVTALPASGITIMCNDRDISDDLPALQRVYSVVELHCRSCVPAGPEVGKDDHTPSPYQPKTIPVTLKIPDEHLDTFPEWKLKGIIQAISKEVGPTIGPVEIRNGCVEMTFELPEEVVEAFLSAVRSGALSRFGVTDAWCEDTIPDDPSLEDFEDRLLHCRTISDRFAVVKAFYRAIVDPSATVAYKDYLDTSSLSFASDVLREILKDDTLCAEARTITGVYFCGGRSTGRWSVEDGTVNFYTGDARGVHPAELLVIARHILGLEDVPAPPSLSLDGASVWTGAVGNNYVRSEESLNLLSLVEVPSHGISLLCGGGGCDYLYGGGGCDRLDGGGSVAYTYNSTGHLIGICILDSCCQHREAANDALYSGNGNDTLRAGGDSDSHLLSDSIESHTASLTDATGRNNGQRLFTLDRFTWRPIFAVYVSIDPDMSTGRLVTHWNKTDDDGSRVNALNVLSGGGRDCIVCDSGTDRLFSTSGFDDDATSASVTGGSGSHIAFKPVVLNARPYVKSPHKYWILASVDATGTVHEYKPVHELFDVTPSEIKEQDLTLLSTAPCLSTRFLIAKYMAHCGINDECARGDTPTLTIIVSDDSIRDAATARARTTYEFIQRTQLTEGAVDLYDSEIDSGAPTGEHSLLIKCYSNRSLALALVGTGQCDLACKAPSVLDHWSVSALGRAVMCLHDLSAAAYKCGLSRLGDIAFSDYTKDGIKFDGQGVRDAATRVAAAMAVHGIVGVIRGHGQSITGHVRQIRLSDGPVTVVTLYDRDDKWIEIEWNMRMIDRIVVPDHTGTYQVFDGDFGREQWTSLAAFMHRVSRGALRVLPLEYHA
jgi:hypothetical protein